MKEEIYWIDPKLIEHNPDNERRNDLYDETIWKSIGSEGFNSDYPIIIRPSKNPKFKYVVVKGDTRLAASLHHKLSSVAVIIRKYDDRRARIETIAENVKRRGFKPLQEARSYLNLKIKDGMTNYDIAEQMCISEAHVREMLSLLNLDLEVQKLIDSNTLPIRQANYISKIKDTEIQKLIAKKVIGEKIDNKETKLLVERINKVPSKAKSILGFEDKFKKSSAYIQKIKQEKDESKQYKEIAENFNKILSDWVAWEKEKLYTVQELSELEKYDFNKLLQYVKDKKETKGYIKIILATPELDKKCYNSEVFKKLKNL